MDWISLQKYDTVEAAILGRSQQSELDLLDPSPVAPKTIAGIECAANTIFSAVEGASMPVIIVGDYDVDGITSTAIMVRLLRYMGCEPKTIIPKRFTDGYGVSSKLLEGVRDSLVITVDNGIAAGDVLDDAVNKGGNKVVVLDHHLADGRQPKCAHAIVDPHLNPEENGFVEYCGAGLCYKLAEYMLDGEAMSVVQNTLNDIQVLACFGTIADSVPLIGDNRRIVMDAIALINSGRARLSKGISKLLSLSCEDGCFDVDAVAYTIAPLINAPGRLYNAGGTSALKMLMCDDEIEATTFGAKMVQINKTRQAKVRDWMDTINGKLAKREVAGGSPIVVYEPDLPEGLVGLVAGRLADTYHIPAIVLARASDGIVKGSVRTYGDFNVKDMLDSMKELFTTYGGHTGAAGISLHEDDIRDLQNRVAKYYNSVSSSISGECVFYDVELRPEDVESALETIKKFKPYGSGVPKPICRINGVQADNIFLMGADKSHIKFIRPGFSAVAFGMAKKYASIGKPAFIDIVGTIGENSFRGKTTTQIIVSDFRAD